jgi:dolichol-phosphate mannosyltransferase
MRKTGRNSLKFLVIIPSYKEMENLKIQIPAILKNFTNSHVLIVDDFSGDATNLLMNDLMDVYPNRIDYICRRENPSYASSLLLGFEFSRKNHFERVIQMDADGSHSIHDIRNLLETSGDVVIGSRYKQNSEIKQFPITRLLYSILGNIYISLLWKTKIRDKTNGFRCFNSEAIEKILEHQYKSQGFSIQIEVLRNLINLRDLQIIEVPTVFRYRVVGESKFDLKKLLEALLLATRLSFKSKDKHD